MKITLANPIPPAGGQPGQALSTTGYASGGPHYTAHRGYSPMDFGAVADGTLHPLSEIYPSLAAAQGDFAFVTSLGQSRDAVALQRCLNLASTPDSLHFGKNIYIPAGSYYLDTTLTLQGVWGLTVRGDGIATQLVYNGSNTVGPLKIVSCQYCTFADFNVRQVGQTPNWAIWLTNTSANTDSIVSSSNRFQRVQVNDGFLDCVIIVFDSGGDANNDLHIFEDCVFKQFQRYGVNIHGGQVHQLRFVRSQFTASTTTNTAGIFSDFGSYLHVDECVFNSCQYNVSTSSFYTGTIDIRNCNCENSRSFANILQANCPVRIRGCRGALAPQPGDYIVNMDNGAGIVNIEENNFFTTNSEYPLVLLNDGFYSVRHVNNYYTTGSGGSTWAARGQGALVIGPVGNTGFTIKSLFDQGNIYLNPDLSPSFFDVGASPYPNSPAAITVDQNEYNPLPGRYQRWQSTQAVAVKGMTGSGQGGAGYEGEIREIWNVGSFNITLVHLSLNPRHQAEFTCSTGADIVLTPNKMVIARYDTQSNSGFGSWRVAGPF